MSRTLTGRKAFTVVAATAVAGSALFVGGVAQAATAKDVPAITKLGPVATTSAGGTWVVVNGRNFNDSGLVFGKVKFGGTALSAATDLIVVSDSKLLAKAPAKTAGIYRVSIENSKGVSLDTPSDNFGYIDAPSITGVDVTTVSAAGGDVVKVTGTDLQHATAVTVDGLPAKITKRAKASNGDDTLSVVTPAHAPVLTASAVDIKVTTPAGSDASSAAGERLTYDPALKSASAKTGAAGTVVTLTGVGFSALHTSPVKLNGSALAAGKFAVLSDTELVVVVPSGLTAGTEYPWVLSKDGSTDVTTTVKFKAA